jgi:EmrB/QacA subfamily drug resistance transporter
MHHHLDLRSKVIIMLSVMASLFLVALDQTIIATALGRIVEEFNAFDSLSWVMTAYLLTTTITVPIAGKLSDLFGRKRVILVGVVIFAVASLFSGLSGSIEQLVIWRAVQGIGGGIITANAFTIIGDLFAARERGRWQGLFGAVFGLSSVIGPVLGGWLTDGQTLFGMTTDWRWTFYINIPVGILAFILILIFCPKLAHDKKPSIDYRGAVYLSIALATLVLAVDNTESIFKDVLTTTGMSLEVLRLIMFSIVVASVLAFIRVERRAKEPILPLRFFRNRNFVLIMGIATLFGSAFMGSILYLVQFNQQVFQATPTESGLMLLPMIGGLMTTSIVSGLIISRTGRYKIFMQIGIILATAMVFALSTLTPESSYMYEAIIMVFLGAGLGVVMPVMNIAVQNEFAQHDLGVATSSSQLFRSLGSTIGIAVFGAMLTAGLTTQLSAIHDNEYLNTIKQNPSAQKIGDFHDTNTLLNLNMPNIKSEVTAGFDEALSTNQTLSEQAKTTLRDNFNETQQEYASTVTHAFSDSLKRIFLIASGLMAAAVVLVFMLKEKRLKTADADDAPGVV